MKVLLHVCCGPCAIYPARLLIEEGHEVAGFFYNPNIHPFSEYEKRREAVIEMSERLELSTIYHRYDFEDFIRKCSGLHSRQEQHEFCWRARMEETARLAASQGFDAFTTTLLSSPYQDIGVIGRLGREIADQYKIKFLERDFRKGFQQSHQVSKEWELYHQNYCGCLYSEKESVESRRKKNKKGESDHAVSPD